MSDYRIIKNISKDFCSANLYDNSIIEIEWDESLKLVEPSHLQKVQEIVAELGDGNRMPLYFTTHPFLVVSPEGQQYATSQEGTRYSKANAVQIEDLATKIDYNVFVKVNKPIVPTKGCSTKEEAFEWLTGDFSV